MFTDKEIEVIARIVWYSSRDHGEDVMGVVLKKTGHTILKDGEVSAFSDKIHAILDGQICPECGGKGVHIPGSPHEYECEDCEGTGRFGGIGDYAKNEDPPDPSTRS